MIVTIKVNEGNLHEEHQIVGRVAEEASRSFLGLVPAMIVNLPRKRRDHQYENVWNKLRNLANLLIKIFTEERRY